MRRVARATDVLIYWLWRGCHALRTCCGASERASRIQETWILDGSNATLKCTKIADLQLSIQEGLPIYMLPSASTHDAPFEIPCTIPPYFIVHKVFYKPSGPHMPGAGLQKLLDKSDFQRIYMASCRLNPAFVLHPQLFGVRRALFSRRRC